VVVAPPFKINEREKHVRSNLDTVTLRVDMSRTDKLKFLVNNGADIAVVRDSSFKPGFDFKSDNVIEIKGISKGVMKSNGTINLKLFTDTHKTTHDFYVIGDSFLLQYDGILGRDFWESKNAVISYCNREILMEDVVLKFDPKHSGAENKILNITMKARSENYVKLLTTCKGQGLISRREIIPGIYMAESLTREMEGACITSIVNTLEEDVTIDGTLVELEEIEEPIQSEAMIFVTTLVEDEIEDTFRQ
jgi:hypothetical protein